TSILAHAKEGSMEHRLLLVLSMQSAFGSKEHRSLDMAPSWSQSVTRLGAPPAAHLLTTEGGRQTARVRLIHPFFARSVLRHWYQISWSRGPVPDPFRAPANEPAKNLLRAWESFVDAIQYFSV